MIAFLYGKLEEKTPEFVLVDVNGIGYQVYIPYTIYEKLPNIREDIKLYTLMASSLYTGNTLYGFLNREEKEIFILLNTVSKIGPKDALKILSKISSSFSDFKKAIIDKDLQFLIDIFGLGKKTAEKLILGLKEKIQKLELKSSDKFVLKKNGHVTDAVSALVTLGYRINEAKEAANSALNNMDNKDAMAEDIIKYALKYL